MKYFKYLVLSLSLITPSFLIASNDSSKNLDYAKAMGYLLGEAVMNQQASVHGMSKKELKYFVEGLSQFLFNEVEEPVIFAMQDDEFPVYVENLEKKGLEVIFEAMSLKEQEILATLISTDSYEKLESGILLQMLQTAPERNPETSLANLDEFQYKLAVFNFYTTEVVFESEEFETVSFSELPEFIVEPLKNMHLGDIVELVLPSSVTEQDPIIFLVNISPEKPSSKPSINVEVIEDDVDLEE